MKRSIYVEKLVAGREQPRREVLTVVSECSPEVKALLD